MSTTKKELAERVSAYRAALNMATGKLTDKDVSEVSRLLPAMSYKNDLISAGTRILWNGIIKRAAVDLWDIETNNPDNAPDLWEDVLYKNGIRIIPETITAGLAFGETELGYWGDLLYKSKINNNVWTPVAYPDGWELQE